MSERLVEGGQRPHRMDAIERVVNRVLAAGIAVSVTLMVAGVALGVADGEGLPSHAVPLDRLLSAVTALEPAGFLSLGLVVLIATPLARVAGSLIAFARLRDRRYVLVTAIVLAVMCVGIVVGHG